MRGVLNIKFHDRLRELPQPRLWKAPREAGLEKVACHEMGQAVNGGVTMKMTIMMRLTELIRLGVPIRHCNVVVVCP